MIAAFDIGGALLQAIRSPEGRAALVEAVGPAVRAELRAVLSEVAQDRLLDCDGLAELLGCTTIACRARIRRDPELSALTVRMGGRRRWRRSEIAALIESRRK